MAILGVLLACAILAVAIWVWAEISQCKRNIEWQERWSRQGHRTLFDLVEASIGNPIFEKRKLDVKPFTGDLSDDMKSCEEQISIIIDQFQARHKSARPELSITHEKIEISADRIFWISNVKLSVSQSKPQ